MLDIKLIRENYKETEEKLRKRDSDIDLEPIYLKDKQERELKVEAEELKQTRNTVSKLIGQKKKNKEDDSKELTQMQEIAVKIKALDQQLKDLENEIHEMLIRLPNIPNDSVPVSLDKEEKITVRCSGEKPVYSFPLKNHVELAKNLKLLDFERASKMSGSQQVMYTGMGAKLEWALVRFMLDIQESRGYQLIIPPFLVNETSLFTSANLPKFADQIYKCSDDNLYLIPTSEVPLTNIHRDEILNEEDLPLRYTSYTPCFRREAGTYGAEERGLIRVHQFNKVEMYRYVIPETSYDHLEALVDDAEDIVKMLGLPYRVTLLVTSDISFQSSKTYDIEVWLPAQGSFYEVSSCSNCEDFQARRGNIRYRPKDKGKLRYVHTLNGSGLATSRLFVAILENYQKEDGTVVIPEVLRPYLGGKECLS